MRRLFAAAAAMLVGVCSPAFAVTFSGTFTVTYQSVDPGLVINVDPISDGLNFDLAAIGQSTGWFDLFNISTPECCTNRDDLSPKPISVAFDFVQPPPSFGGDSSGVTGSFFLLNYVDWDQPYIDLSFGNGGVLRAALSDALFGFNNHSATVEAKFTLLALPTVPIPPAVILFGGGLLALGTLSRRRKHGRSLNAAALE